MAQRTIDKPPAGQRHPLRPDDAPALRRTVSGEAYGESCGGRAVTDVDRLIGGDGPAPWRAPQGRSPSPWVDERAHDADFWPTHTDRDEDIETMSGPACGPARGIVLAFVPAVLAWGGLIALGTSLLR